jgi:hypothetical protein
MCKWYALRNTKVTGLSSRAISSADVLLYVQSKLPLIHYLHNRLTTQDERPRIAKAIRIVQVTVTKPRPHVPCIYGRLHMPVLELSQDGIIFQHGLTSTDTPTSTYLQPTAYSRHTYRMHTTVQLLGS